MTMKNIVFSLIWFLLLIYLVWPVAGMGCFVWIGLQPLEEFLPIIRDLNNFLEVLLVTWPRECGKAIANGSTEFPRSPRLLDSWRELQSRILSFFGGVGRNEQEENNFEERLLSSEQEEIDAHSTPKEQPEAANTTM